MTLYLGTDWKKQMLKRRSSVHKAGLSTPKRKTKKNKKKWTC